MKVIPMQARPGEGDSIEVDPATPAAEATQERPRRRVVAIRLPEPHRHLALVDAVQADDTVAFHLAPVLPLPEPANPEAITVALIVAVRNEESQGYWTTVVLEDRDLAGYVHEELLKYGQYYRWFALRPVASIPGNPDESPAPRPN